MINFFNNIAGIDIESGAVRLLQLQKPSLIKTLIELPLPKETFHQGKLKGFQALLTALSTLKQNFSRKPPPVVIGFSHQAVIMQTISLPKSLSSAECELEIENNLSDYLPALTEKMVFDLFFKKNNDPLNHSLWFVAAKTEQVTLFQNLMHQSGFKLKGIDVVIYSLARCLQLITNKENGFFALIDCREEYFSLVVIKETELVFYETVEFIKTVELSELIILIYKAFSRCLSVNHSLQIKKIILSGRGELSVLATLLKVQIKIEMMIFSQFFQGNFVEDLINRSAIALGLALWRQHD